MAVFNYKIERKIKASCNKGVFFCILKKYHIAFVVFHPQLFLRYVHLSAGMVDAMILRMRACQNLRLMGVFGGGDSVWGVG
jgi:hypothetical protein